jgi:magnesium chelatase family protein
MIARRLPTILPPLSAAEAIEVTRIQSVAGLHGQGGLVSERPFRSPHHSISASGLVGGGSTPLPGEATLAHNGVLFLDELSEFSRSALEALRQPLEDGHVVIVRSQRVVRYPSRCMLVAASNPCPCGAGGDRCRCSANDVARHERKLSGPLLDRIDVQVHVGRPSARALASWSAPRSAVLRERVVAARGRQAERFAGTDIVCNAHMTPRMLSELVAATLPARRVLDAVHDDRALSARGYARVLRVARTIADLEGTPRVEPDHVHQAVSLRTSLPAEAFAA